jgi:hypothetical protein
LISFLLDAKCYFLEERNNSSKVETHLGEFCGEEIEEPENTDCINNSGQA